MNFNFKNFFNNFFTCRNKQKSKVKGNDNSVNINQNNDNININGYEDLQDKKE